jgi:hypothetical protein
VFGTVNTFIPKQNGQDAAYSDTMTGKVVLAPSIRAKRRRGVVIGLVFGVVCGFTTIGLIVWMCRSDDPPVLWIEPYRENGDCNTSFQWKDHFYVSYFLPGQLDFARLHAFQCEFVAPSDIWMPSDLELNMMASTTFQADGLGAPMYVGQNGQDHSEQFQLELEPNNADIEMQGMSSRLQRDLKFQVLIQVSSRPHYHNVKSDHSCRRTSECISCRTASRPTLSKLPRTRKVTT